MSKRDVGYVTFECSLARPERLGELGHAIVSEAFASHEHRVRKRAKASDPWRRGRICDLQDL